MHIALVGTGSIGSRHLHNIKHLQPETQFTFIRSRGYEDDLSRQYNATVLKELTGEVDYDAIIIANPSSHHIDYLEKAIKNNFCCFIEKPVLTSLEDCNKILSIIKNSSYQSTSMVGCNLRYLPSLQKIRELVKNGQIGRVVRVSLEAGKWLPDWRPHQDYKQSYSASKTLGGGVILDLIHEIDIARWMFGDYVDYKIFSSKLSDLEIETEDTACIILSKEGGPLISINLDYISRNPVRNYRFIGTEGTIEWDLFRKTAQLITSSASYVITNNPNDFDVSQTYLIAMKEFLGAIKNKENTSQDIREGMKTTELALRMKENF